MIDNSSLLARKRNFNKSPSLDKISQQHSNHKR